MPCNPRGWQITNHTLTACRIMPVLLDREVSTWARTGVRPLWNPCHFGRAAQLPAELETPKLLPERRLSPPCYPKVSARRHCFSNRLRKMNMSKKAAEHHKQASEHHTCSGIILKRQSIMRPATTKQRLMTLINHEATQITHGSMRNTRREPISRNTARNRTEGGRVGVSCPRVSGNPSTSLVGSIVTSQRSCTIRSSQRCQRASDRSYE
jgi:hypothetical protein